MPAQRHSQPTPTSLDQGCIHNLCVFFGRTRGVGGGGGTDTRLCSLEMNDNVIIDIPLALVTKPTSVSSSQRTTDIVIVGNLLALTISLELQQSVFLCSVSIIGPGIVREPIQQRAHAQLVGEHSATVVSVR